MKRDRRFDPEEESSSQAFGGKKLHREPGRGSSHASSFSLLGAHEPAPWMASSSSSFSSSSSSSSSSSGGGGSSAIVSSTEQQRREKFLRHLHALNAQFADMAEAALSENPLADLVDASNDYLQYAKDLEERYLRRYGEVFTFGSGECGQLAHGVEESEDLSVNRPRIVHSLRDKRIRLLACGGIHTVAVGDDGRVWTWGCNDDGALGRATGPIDPEDMDKGMRGDENMPAVVDGGGLAGQQVELVACGDSHTLALTVDGSVFGWGCYKDKEGRKWFDAQRDNPATFTAKSIKRQQNEPMRIQSLPAGAVTQLSCGATFNACLLRDGQARLWGLGETGELARKVKGWDATPPESTMRNGEGDYLFDQILDQHLTPKAPEMADGSAPPVFKGIGTGMYHTFLIGTSHTVYASGLNNYGQLGLNDEFKQEPGKQPVLVHDKYWQLRPLKDLEGRGVTKIAGGQHHSMALAESAAADDSNPGTIYTWGRSDYGQLGVGDEDIDTGAGDFHNAPIECPLPAGAGKIVAITCGENHNLVLARKSSTASCVYTWGFGESGALGQGGADEDEMRPKAIDLAKAKLPNVTMVQMAAGGQHTALLGEVTKAK